MREESGPTARAKEPVREGASQGRTPGGPGPREVRGQLDAILGSDDFDASRRSREFLRFIVEETLAGRAEGLTQGAIATVVFGRREDFDPVVDPIVRIQAGRLRRSLERYYLLSGRRDALRIELPKGTYVPAFRGTSFEGERDAPAAAAVAPASGDGWPVVLLGGFEPAGDEPALAATARRMGEELALELGRYGVVRILRQPPGGLDPAVLARARFALEARVEPAAGGLRATAHLTDRLTGHQVWGDEYVTAPQPGRWSGSPEDVARVIAARLGAEEGVVVQHLAAERRKRVGADSPYDAFLLSCEFFFARDPDAFAHAVKALRRVVKADPECGWAWTRLARLSVANVAFEVSSIPTPLDEALECAQNGVRVDPSSRSARCILAVAFLLKGELAAGREELEHALRSSPDSLVYLEIIGYQMMLLGDWDRGRELCLSALERNPHCLPHVQFGLWADFLRRGEVEQAYHAALEHRDPTFFVRAAMRATCLGLLGRTAEGELEVARLLAGKPDFPSRGRKLLECFIKFPEVMERVVEGLGKVGLKLA